MILDSQIIGVYKPKGPTSHDVIDAVRRITGEKKVGHAGTLDPLASGVLVIGIGRPATKRLADEVKKEKEYIGVVRLGATSTTDDAEGNLQQAEIDIDAIPSRTDVEGAIRTFEGTIEQIPPIYSAIKVKGTPAHRRVRSGEEVELKARKVEIKEIEVLDYTWPTLELRAITGPGVYIRSLARDIGESLGVGGYLQELERTRVGEYTKEEALSLEELKKQYE